MELYKFSFTSKPKMENIKKIQWLNPRVAPSLGFLWDLHAYQAVQFKIFSIIKLNINYYHLL